MTTSNKIIAQVIEDAIYVSLESLHSENDSVTYVFKQNGLNVVKQEVQVGETNSNDAVIKLGLAAGDKVFLSVPAGQEDEEVSLLKELNGKRKKEEEGKTPTMTAVSLPK